MLNSLKNSLASADSFLAMRIFGKKLWRVFAAVGSLSLLAFAPSWAAHAVGTLLPKTPVVVKWAGKRCSGIVKETKPTGEVRIAFDGEFCGEPTEWYKPSAVQAVNFVDNARGIASEGVKVGSKVLAYWGGFYCSGKILKLSDTGFAQLTYDYPTCGDVKNWQEAKGLLPFFFAEETEVKGELWKKGRSVSIFLGGKKCVGNVEQLTSNGFVRVSYDKEFCGNSSEWRKADTFDDDISIDGFPGVPYSVEDENPQWRPLPSEVLRGDH